MTSCIMEGRLYETGTEYAAAGMRHRQGNFESIRYCDTGIPVVSCVQAAQHVGVA
jgi:uncharacterized protein YraI